MIAINTQVLNREIHSGVRNRCWANHYSLHLSRSYVNITLMDKFNPNMPQMNYKVSPKPRKFHKETTMEYIRIIPEISYDFVKFQLNISI